jgi:hypothetical protein
MKCRHFRRLVVLATEAELTTEERAIRNRHQAECLACREFCQDMRGIEYLLSLISGVRAPADFSGMVMARIRETKERSRSASSLFIWRR